MTITRACPNCKKSIPTSWYVLGDWWSYRCVNCKTLLEWKKARTVFFTLALLVFALLLFFTSHPETNRNFLLLGFLALNFLVRFFIPVKYVVTASQDKTRIVLEALDSHGDSECGVISLSLETGISQDSIRNVFKNHKRYFIPINGVSTFKLNRLTVENGSIDKILLSIEQQKFEGRVATACLLGFTVGVLIG